MDLLLLQVEVAERGFDKIFDVSIALAFMFLVIAGLAWYIIRLEKQHATELKVQNDELKLIRAKREAEQKDSISVMLNTQNTLQQIIQSNQNLPNSIKGIIDPRIDEVVRMLDKIKA